MPQTDRDRAIALAGVLQAADLVRGIARRGQANPEDVETCLNSLIKIDAASSDDVYDGVLRLRPGLQLLEQQLGNPRDMELTRYAVTLLSLEPVSYTHLPNPGRDNARLRRFLSPPAVRRYRPR